jgi:HK97 family phage portal protein
MANRSLVTVLAAGVRSLVAKGNDMSLVTSMRPMWGPIRESFPGAWQRNVECESVSTLASFSPVYACITRIASDIAKLGLVLLDDDGKGVLEPASKDSPYWRVPTRPNKYQNRIQFIRQWLLSKLIFGNAYALKVRDGRGMVMALYLLDPRRVTPLITPDGDVYYSVGADRLAQVPIGLGAAPATEIIHDRGPTLWHPLVGIAPLYACALSGTLGLRIQQNSAAFFENMSRPSGILKAPNEISDITAARLTREWNENFSRSKIGKVAVLGNGLEYQAMAETADASQLVEQFGAAAVDVARAFGMPSYKINEGQMPTSNNVAALNQQYYSDCLQSYIEDIEICLNEGLELLDGYSLEFDLDGLMRMDPSTQMDVLVKGVSGTILTPNEARQRLNRRSVEGGDSLWMQQQNYSMTALAKRDKLANPFAAGSPPPPPPAPPAPAPAPAPADQSAAAAASKAVETALLTLSHDALAAVERATRSEQLAVRAEEARVDAEAQRAAAVERETAARAEAVAAVERAAAAEQLVDAPPAELVEKFADDLVERFARAEPACG